MFYQWLSCAGRRFLHQVVTNNGAVHPQEVCLLGDSSVLIDLVHFPNSGRVSGSEYRSGSDNSIQFINFGRVGDKSFKD